MDDITLSSIRLSTDNLKQHEQNAEASIDQRLKRDRAVQYLCFVTEAKKYARLPQRVLSWICEVLNTNAGESTIEFEQKLQNGVVLAKLAACISPDSKKLRIYDAEQQKPLEYRHTDNINAFLDTLRAIHFPAYFTFELVDLYDQKNMPKVIFCIHALSKFLFKANKAPAIAKVDAGEILFGAEEIKQVGENLAGVAWPEFDDIEQTLNDMFAEESIAKEAPLIEVVMPVEEEFIAESAEASASVVESEILEVEKEIEAEPCVVEQPIVEAELVQSCWHRAINNAEIRKKLDSLVLVQNAFRAHQRVIQRKSGCRSEAASDALFDDRARLVTEINDLVYRLEAKEIDIQCYGASGAERCRKWVLKHRRNTKPVELNVQRPSLKKLAGEIVDNQELIRCVPEFFNFARGNGALGWARLITEVYPKSGAIAARLIAELRDITLETKKLGDAFSLPGINESITALMKAISNCAWMVHLFASIDAKFVCNTLFADIAASEIQLSILNEVFVVTKPSLEISNQWNVQIMKLVHAAKGNQEPSWEVCYLNAKLAKGIVSGDAILAIVDTSLKHHSASLQGKNLDQVLIDVSGRLSEISLSTQSRPYWLTYLAEIFGLQPDVLDVFKEYPKFGCYARKLAHLLSKHVIEGVNGKSVDSVLYIWSEEKGVFKFKVDSDPIFVLNFDQVIEPCKKIQICHLSFDSASLFRILTQKLIVIEQ